MDLYYIPVSAPCRSVFMTAKALGVELNKKFLNLQNGEHLAPEYLAINPQHTVPTLVDDGFVLWESHAIIQYLVEKYGKDDSLFPKEPKKRAVIAQRLFFDSGLLYERFADYLYPQFTEDLPADPEKFQKLEEALQFLESFLDANTYVAGDTLTIADIAILATISTIDVAAIDFKNLVNLTKWYEHCKTIVPGFDENWQGCLRFAQVCQDFRDGKITFQANE